MQYISQIQHKLIRLSWHNTICTKNKAHRNKRKQTNERTYSDIYHKKILFIQPLREQWPQMTTFNGSRWSCSRLSSIGRMASYLYCGRDEDEDMESHSILSCLYRYVSIMIHILAEQ
mmetsp:Transcript_62438/g.99269  ORF Transcript_62438/g.99269 Transcript_62438/m.99269 type:complete len:117 (+) Transcript_62438:200-550(+)